MGRAARERTTILIDEKRHEAFYKNTIAGGKYPHLSAKYRRRMKTAMHDCSSQLVAYANRRHVARITLEASGRSSAE